MCGWSEQRLREGAACPHPASCEEIGRYCGDQGTWMDNTAMLRERFMRERFIHLSAPQARTAYVSHPDRTCPHPHTRTGCAPHPHTRTGCAPHPHTRTGRAPHVFGQDMPLTSHTRTGRAPHVSHPDRTCPSRLTPGQSHPHRTCPSPSHPDRTCPSRLTPGQSHPHRTCPSPSHPDS